MKRLSANITIGNLAFDFVSEVQIISSWKALTDTCTITLPRNIKLKDGGVLPSIKAGDEVIVQLGYDGGLREEFRGYVTRLKADLPLVIECEDELWKLKQSRVTESWNSVDLQTLLSTIITGVSVSAESIELGGYRIDQVSPAKVLYELRKEFGIRSYFRNSTLYVGLLHRNTPIEFDYNFQKDIINATELEYRRAEDYEIKLRAVSIQEDNKTVEVEIGDAEGEQRTLHYYGLSESDLRSIAQAEIDKLKRDGYRGALTTFGGDWVRHGDVVVLSDGEYPDRAGKYLVESVRTSFGQGGYRKKIELGNKL